MKVRERHRCHLLVRPGSRLAIAVLLALGAAARTDNALAEPEATAAPPPVSVVASAEKQRLLEYLLAYDTNPATVVREARAAQARARAANDDALLSLALSVECRGLYRENKLEAADTACAEALKLAERGDDLAMFAVQRMLGTLTTERGQPMAALQNAFDSLAAARRSGNELARAAAFGNLGTVAQFAGANSDAVEYYDRALTIANQIGSDNLRLQVANNLGVLLLESGDPEAARAHFAQALAASQRLRAGLGGFAVRYGIALADLESGRNSEAVAALRSLVAQEYEEQTPAQRAEAQMFLARGEFKLGNMAAAEAAARTAAADLRRLRPIRAYPAQALLIDILTARGKLEEAARLSDSLVQEVPVDARGRVELLEARARLLAAQGQHRAAYVTLIDAQSAREQQSLARAARTLAFMRARTEAQERFQELTHLRAQQARAEDEAHQARIVRNFSLAIVAITLIGAIALWLMARVRRKLEAEIERRRSLDALGKLTGGVAHDFNNLMTIVQQAMDLLRQDPAVKSSGDALILIDEAEGAARLGGHITRQLLTFARQQPMQPEDVPLRQYIEQRRLLFERTLGESMRLEVILNDEHCGVRVDPGQLTTAIINLLANSRDAMGGKGEVTMRIEAIHNAFRDRRWAELPIGRYVSIAIIDRGKGMSAEVARQAVTPFFTTKGEAGGTGLGLSTVHGFVVQSGGILLLKSEPNLGTTITLVLPHC